MATTPAAEPRSPEPKTNHIGLTVIDYKGGKTTLCAGCGHNAISERIIEAMYDMGVQPERVAKLSGIGCSSKSPAYFMNRTLRRAANSAQLRDALGLHAHVIHGFDDALGNGVVAATCAQGGLAALVVNHRQANM